jgi:hypothetical protein
MAMLTAKGICFLNSIRPTAAASLKIGTSSNKKSLHPSPTKRFHKKQNTCWTNTTKKYKHPPPQHGCPGELTYTNTDTVQQNNDLKVQTIHIQLQLLLLAMLLIDDKQKQTKQKHWNCNEPKGHSNAFFSSRPKPLVSTISMVKWKAVSIRCCLVTTCKGK